MNITIGKVTTDSAVVVHWLKEAINAWGYILIPLALVIAYFLYKILKTQSEVSNKLDKIEKETKFIANVMVHVLKTETGRTTEKIKEEFMK